MNYPSNYSRYTEVLKKYYEGRDSSHGWEHVEKVCMNALTLCSEIGNFSDKDIKIIVIAALGHDIWDHKYVKKKDQKKIKIRFKKNLCELGFLDMDRDLIVRIIDSISFSTEYKLRQEKIEFNFKKPEKRLRNIVSDADKLEALGKICVERMIEYEIVSNNTKVPLEQHQRHIKRHCQEKLYLLIDEGYIRNRKASIKARPLMQEMKNIVDNDDVLEKFIKDIFKKSIK